MKVIAIILLAAACIAIAAAVIAPAVLSVIPPSAVKTAPAPAKSQPDLEADSAVLTLKVLIGQGKIRIDSPSHRGWVDPNYWAAMNADEKENLARIMSFTSIGTITVYDMQSAKKLASYGDWSGFEAY